MNEFLAVGNIVEELAGARAVSVFAIVLASAVLRLAAKLAFDRLAKRFADTANLYDDAVLAALRKPVGWAIWSFGILFAAQVAGRGSEAEIFTLVDPARDVAAIALLAWAALRFISFIEQHLADAEYGRKEVDQSTAVVISKLLRASVIVTALLLALHSLGFSIAGVLAFGGLGGLAVGFAARDMLANFFGTLMIFFDRPFAVGDWIRSSDRDIEGTVEDIGWRMTRIRTFDERPLYVPNAVFSTLTVENPSRMRNRRIYEIIGVRYDDLATLRPIIDDVRAMLLDHPQIDTSRTLMVNFLNFGESSLDVMVYTFTKTTVWTEFHTVKEDVLFKIAAIVAEHGAEMAFPTRTLQLTPPAAEPNA